ncbi:glycosyltransferase family 2 protein [Halobacillus kuroshimensis]|uniref:Glycosyltransferase family 2 protein n=1 Tax=Halobacillus kuroshimensis TaxID=302481 RepID=A0ABS3DV45_9BACI|nr:glycosyltransferase family A protein [Halobacillus kuroshimensis]MBN8235215.1 glycosyltransferase family 2 protein [Halobacillus kuroshimensis]
MMSNDRVSIITPAYHAAGQIMETIRTVQHQTYTNWEMIIVDDCSEDETVSVVKRAQEKDDRIRLICLHENKGPAFARNRAIESARGRYLAFLDSDDLWMPEKLEKQLSFMKAKHAAFTFTAYKMMKENGEETNLIFKAPIEVTYKDLLKNTSIGTLTVMLDRRRFGSIRMPLYRDCSEDYGLWLMLLSSGSTAYGLNEPLAFYRKCSDSLSSNKWKSAKKTWNTYRKVKGINGVRSFWYFMNYTVHGVKKHFRPV